MVYGIIYCITHIPTNRKYYGQTRKSVEQRFTQHLKLAQRKSGYFLHHALQKYPKSEFSCRVIKECYSHDELDFFEKLFINNELTTDARFGFNIASGGHQEMSDSIKTKISLKRVLYFSDPENRIKLSNSRKGNLNPMFGRKMPETAKKILSEKLSGENAPLYGRKGNDHPFWGKPNHPSSPSAGKTWKLSDETKMKQSASKLGDKNPMKGKDVTAKTRKKLSDGLKAYWKKKKEASKS